MSNTNAAARIRHAEVPSQVTPSQHPSWYQHPAW